MLYVANSEPNRITITMPKGPSSCDPAICFDPQENYGSFGVGAANLGVLSPMVMPVFVDDSHFVLVRKCN